MNEKHEDLFVGIDLHSTNNVVGILTKTNKRFRCRKLPNRMEAVEKFLAPFKDRIVGIAFESTYNWYWLGDGLNDEGYPIYLAHPPAIKQYSGLKHTDDKHDAFFLAHLLLLEALPTGYIYPKDFRSLRDLNRKRLRLVRQRTEHVQSLKSLLNRSYALQLSGYRVKTLKEEELAAIIKDDNLLTAAVVHVHTINFLNHQIEKLETKVTRQVKLLPCYEKLLAIPGVGKIYAAAIMLEVGDINRFPSDGDYASYCRKVKSERLSNEKSKGKNNRKNGNPYLSLAYSGVAEKARRYCPLAKAYFERKMKKTCYAVAYGALANKIAKATYHVIRKNEDYDAKRLFGCPNK